MSSPPPSDELLWQEFREEFEDLRDLIETVRVETREEAVGQTFPRWADPEIGTVPAWLLVPYRNDADADRVKSWHEAARSLIPTLEWSLKEQSLTLEFARAGGTFCRAASIVETAYLSEGDEVPAKRSGRAGAKAVTKHAQRKWVAHLLKRLDAMTRKHAEIQIVKIINAILSAQKFPPGFDAEWFESMLDQKGNLKTSYGHRHFYKRRMMVLLRESTDDIPEIPIGFSATNLRSWNPKG